MRRWLRSSAAAATVALLVVCTNDAALAAPAPRSRSVEAVADPGTPTDPVGDQRLIESIDGAATPDRQVPVEIVGTETSTVETTVKRLGGVVTGAVDDAVVQGFVPAGSVERLADSAGVGFVQAPRLVTRPTAHAPVRIEVGPGIGPIVGQNVAVTNAAAWQAAGIDGSVKVGIVDYFDLGLWSTAEAGPLPDDAHRFCRDTSGEPNSVCSATHNDGKNDGIFTLTYSDFARRFSNVDVER